MTKFFKENLLPTLESISSDIQKLGKSARWILKCSVLERTRKRKLRDPKNYDTELVQVAAVAVAALTDYRMQNSNKHQIIVEQDIWQDIINERRRQDAKFEREMPTHEDPLIFATVLVEEVSEVFAEIENQ